MQLVHGSQTVKLAQEISILLSINSQEAQIKKFSDQETYLRITQPNLLKGEEVIVVGTGASPANDNFLETLMLINAARQVGARKIILVLPFYPYRRMERVMLEGEPVTAQLVADCLGASRVDGLVVVDLHSPRILDYLKIPLVHVNALPLFIDYFKKFIKSTGSSLNDWCSVAPDQGSASYAWRLSQALGISCVETYKERNPQIHDRSQVKKLVGEIKPFTVLLDDEINTAGTICQAAAELKQRGAKHIYAAVTHGICSGTALGLIKDSAIEKVLVTNTVPGCAQGSFKKIETVSVATLLAAAIRKIISRI